MTELHFETLFRSGTMTFSCCRHILWVSVHISSPAAFIHQLDKSIEAWVVQYLMTTSRHDTDGKAMRASNLFPFLSDRISVAPKKHDIIERVAGLIIPVRGGITSMSWMKVVTGLESWCNHETDKVCPILKNISLTNSRVSREIAGCTSSKFLSKKRVLVEPERKNPGAQINDTEVY